MSSSLVSLQSCMRTVQRVMIDILCSLLSIRDNNRRTAHVVSQWFSQLFVLRKRDVQDVLENYPGAKDVLMRKAM